MNVLMVAENELKIFLTDTEVIKSFGNYENLYCMSRKGRIVMSVLLRDIIFKNYSLNGDESFKTRIKAQKNRGCEITVSLVTKNLGFINEQWVFFFACEEDLNQFINFVCKTKNRFPKEAELCKIGGKYVLIVKNTDEKSANFLNEFCVFRTDDNILLEFIKEHGKCVLCGEKLEKYAESLIKDF